MPVLAVKGDRLPAFVGPGTLLVAVSYSGNTAETLSAVEQGLAAGARLVAVTSGGALAELAQSRGAPLVTIEGGRMPRAALWSLVVPVCLAAEAAGVLPPLTDQVCAAADALDEEAAALGPAVETAANPAKQAALRLLDRLPVVWGSGPLGAVAATRFRTQCNENAKVSVVSGPLPEANHNDVMGLEGGLGPGRELVLLRDEAGEHDRDGRRIQAVLAAIGATDPHRPPRRQGPGPGPPGPPDRLRRLHLHLPRHRPRRRPDPHPHPRPGQGRPVGRSRGLQVTDAPPVPAGTPEPHHPGVGAPEREGSPAAEGAAPVVHSPPVPEAVRVAAEALEPRLAERPVVALVLGSGLGGLADEVEEATRIPAAELPGMPVPRVPGHSGAVVAGRLAGVPVLVLAGRVHTYEGYSAAEVAFATRVAAQVGCRALVATNAAGGLNLDYDPADLMVLTDHISFLFDNPLRGAPDFVDLAGAYDPALRAAAVEAGAGQGRARPPGGVPGRRRALLRDPGRDRHVPRLGRRRGRHVDRARGDRRPRPRAAGGRHLGHHQRAPARRHPDQPRRGPGGRGPGPAPVPGAGAVAASCRRRLIR